MDPLSFQSVFWKSAFVFSWFDIQSYMVHFHHGLDIDLNRPPIDLNLPPAETLPDRNPEPEVQQVPSFWGG